MGCWPARAWPRAAVGTGATRCRPELESVTKLPTAAALWLVGRLGWQGRWDVKAGHAPRLRIGQPQETEYQPPRQTAQPASPVTRCQQDLRRHQQRGVSGLLQPDTGHGRHRPWPQRVPQPLPRAEVSCTRGGTAPSLGRLPEFVVPTPTTSRWSII